MECLSVERRTRGDTSFKGQETAACQARTVHATDGCIFWGMSLLLRLIFFSKTCFLYLCTSCQGEDSLLHGVTPSRRGA